MTEKEMDAKLMAKVVTEIEEFKKYRHKPPKKIILENGEEAVYMDLNETTFDSWIDLIFVPETIRNIKRGIYSGEVTEDEINKLLKMRNLVYKFFLVYTIGSLRKDKVITEDTLYKIFDMDWAKVESELILPWDKQNKYHNMKPPYVPF